MANISQNVNIEMLEKLPDGTYKRKYPKTRSDTGVTFDEHLADLASQEVGKGADLIGLPDANNNFTSTTIGGAMNELFTNVSNGKSLVGGAITGVDDSIVIPADPTFGDLANAISGISTGVDISNVSAGNVFIYEELRRVGLGSTTWKATHSVGCNFSGSVRVEFLIGVSAGIGYGQIYINGAPVGIQRTAERGNPRTYIEDINVVKGDTLAIYGRRISSTANPYIEEFRLRLANNVYFT